MVGRSAEPSVGRNKKWISNGWRTHSGRLYREYRTLRSSRILDARRGRTALEEDRADYRTKCS